MHGKKYKNQNQPQRGQKRHSGDRMPPDNPKRRFSTQNGGNKPSKKAQYNDFHSKYRKNASRQQRANYSAQKSKPGVSNANGIKSKSSYNTSHKGSVSEKPYPPKKNITNNLKKTVNSQGGGYAYRHSKNVADGKKKAAGNVVRPNLEGGKP